MVQFCTSTFVFNENGSVVELSGIITMDDIHVETNSIFLEYAFTHKTFKDVLFLRVFSKYAVHNHICTHRKGPYMRQMIVDAG